MFGSQELLNNMWCVVMLEKHIVLLPFVSGHLCWISSPLRPFKTLLYTTCHWLFDRGGGILYGHCLGCPKKGFYISFELDFFDHRDLLTSPVMTLEMKFGSTLGLMFVSSMQTETQLLFRLLLRNFDKNFIERRLVFKMPNKMALDGPNMTVCYLTKIVDPSLTICKGNLIKS